MLSSAPVVTNKAIGLSALFFGVLKSKCKIVSNGMSCWFDFQEEDMNMNDASAVRLKMSCFRCCGRGIIFVGIHVSSFSIYVYGQGRRTGRYRSKKTRKKYEEGKVKGSFKSGERKERVSVD